MKAHGDWKAEDQRQAQELCDAIQNAIHEHGQRVAAEGRPPILNAVFGALATVTGTALASIEDPRHRKAVRRSMDKAIPQVMAETRVKGFAQTFVVGAPKH